MSATAELGGGEPEGEVSGGDIKGATGSQTERLKHGGILVCRECRQQESCLQAILLILGQSVETVWNSAFGISIFSN